MHDEEPLIWTHGAHCEAWDLREGTVDGLTNNRRARHPQASTLQGYGEADTWTGIWCRPVPATKLDKA